MTFLRLFYFDPHAPLLFTSGAFLLWFSLFYPLFLLVRRARWARLALVTLFSAFVYYKCAGGFVLVLALTCVADFWIALRIARTANRRARRAWLTLSLALSVGLLGYFKYTNFVVGGLAQLFSASFEPMQIALPAGISFYTFESISYVVEVYRGELEPTTSLLEYACFLSYFPHLFAGPILRARDLLHKLRQEPALDSPRVNRGLLLVLSGLAKKALIADYLARFCDQVFSGGAGLGGFEILLGVYGYALQIYFDFSGYSDLAVGLGLLTGLELPENFQTPYGALGISDFWRRWHVTLSSWLRDYVYLPLGGNRRGRLRTYLNLLGTMVIGGLWHGAGASFVVWGATHGLLLCGEKAAAQGVARLRAGRVGRALYAILTFHVVALLWIPFRTGDLRAALSLAERILGDFALASVGPVLHARAAWIAMLLCAALLSQVSRAMLERAARIFARAPIPARAAVLVVVIQCLLELREANVQPFIYFQF